MSTSRHHVCGIVWALLAGAPVFAADEYLVPEKSAAITAEFPGFVETDRGRLQTITPPAERLIIAWCGENGRTVVPGDPIAVFDPTMIVAELPQKQADAVGAEAEYSLSLLRLDQAQAALEDGQRQAQGELLALRAQRAALGEDAVGPVVLARARADQALAEVATSERALHRLRVQAEAGDATAQAVAAAEYSVVVARLAQARAEAVWSSASTRDRSLEHERLRLLELGVLGRLGLQRNPDGTDRLDPALGFSGRLAENAKRRGAQEATLAGERDARLKSARESLRDSHDHTPLGWISVRLATDPATNSTRWDFSPANPTADKKSHIDHGDEFSAARGWGWDRSVNERMQAGGDHTWALIREAATWRCALPNGRYVVTVGTGAADEWDGAFVRATGGGPIQVISVSNRIAGGTWPSAEAEVEITAGMLTVLVGDDQPKTLRATASGMLLLHQSTKRGRKTEWRQRPLAYLAEPSAMRINGRVAQELAPLLNAGEPGPGSAPSRSSPSTSSKSAGDAASFAGIATRVAAVMPPDFAPTDPPLVGTITSVGTKPVGTTVNDQGWNEQDQGTPQDLGAREVMVSLLPVDAARVRVRSAVRVRISTLPPAGIWALAPWLVVTRDSKSWVYERDVGYLDVPAQRLGGQTLVRGLRPGMRLVVPAGPPPEVVITAQKPSGFAGEVVTGVRTRMTMGGSWGRVASCIADGTDVTVGDDVLTLYNPAIDQHRDDLKRERQNANRAFQEAAANRREQVLAAGEQRRTDLIAEGNARLDLAQARKSDDQLPVVVADLALAEAARVQRVAVATATAGLATPGTVALADARTAARRAELAAQRATLQRAQSGRSADWLAAESSAGTWQQALDVLGDRERIADLARAQDRAAVLTARAALDEMLQDQDWVEDFERNKTVRASATGRLYWLNAWNDQSRTMGKVTKDMTLWSGVPVAEIVDLAKLAFAAEVPEPRYPHLTTGQTVAVTFPALGDVRLVATIAKIGQALGPPRDARAAGPDAPVADQRVFTVTVDLTIPEAQRGRVMPGVRGFLELPVVDP